MWLYQPVKFIFLLGVVLTCCKIAGYSGVFDPWQQLVAGAEDVYNGDENSEVVKNDNSAVSQLPQPASQLQPQLPEMPVITVSSGVSDTPALDALLNELNAEKGEI